MHMHAWKGYTLEASRFGKLLEYIDIHESVDQNNSAYMHKRMEEWGLRGALPELYPPDT